MRRGNLSLSLNLYNKEGIYKLIVMKNYGRISRAKLTTDHLFSIIIHIFFRPFTMIILTANDVENYNIILIKSQRALLGI